MTLQAEVAKQEAFSEVGENAPPTDEEKAREDKLKRVQSLYLVVKKLESWGRVVRIDPDTLSDEFTGPFPSLEDPSKETPEADEAEEDQEFTPNGPEGKEEDEFKTDDQGQNW